MCGRFTLTDPDPRMLRMRFDIAESASIEEQPRFNIAPTDPVLAVRETDERRGRDAGRLRWGLVPGHWALEKGQRPLINARAESIETQPAFADSVRERRCLIPADGFYEWAKREDGSKQPVWISRVDDELFTFAGIWAEIKAKTAESGVLHSCAIVTCEPNELVRPVHNRMPVILPREAEAAWLSPATPLPDALALLRPLDPDALELRPVADHVNNVREDGPHLLEPPQESLSLF